MLIILHHQMINALFSLLHLIPIIFNNTISFQVSSCPHCLHPRDEFSLFFFSFFYYCVKSPCTNPTLLLSSGLWKWTGCKTCRVLRNQISICTPTQTLSPYSNFYFYLCSAEFECYATVCYLCKR